MEYIYIYIYIYDNEFRQTRKHVSNNKLFSRKPDFVACESLLVIRFSKRFDKLKF